MCVTAVQGHSVDEEKRPFCLQQQLPYIYLKSYYYPSKSSVKLNTIHSSFNIYPRIIPKSRICSVGEITALTVRLIWSTLIVALNYICLFQQIAVMPPMFVMLEWEEQKLCRISGVFTFWFVVVVVEFY